MKQQIQYKLRLNLDRHTWLKTRAAKNRRSINSELNMMLDEKYEDDLKKEKKVKIEVNE